MASDDNPPPERPRAEPEIIPPRQGGRNDPFSRSYETQRIYVSRVGPLGFALLALAIAAIGAILAIAFLGAILIWIPVAALLVVVAAIFRMLRG